MAPRGQYSERHLVTTPHDDYEANRNRMTDGQDHVLSQADALTNKHHLGSKLASFNTELIGFYLN